MQRLSFSIPFPFLQENIILVEQIEHYGKVTEPAARFSRLSVKKCGRERRVPHFLLGTAATRAVSSRALARLFLTQPA